LSADETGGFIIRTVAETATDAELRGDIEYLKKLWHGIRGRALTAPAPTLLYQDLSLAQRVLRDIAGESTGRIIIDSRENFQKLQEFAAEYMPKCSRSSSTTPASGRFSISTTSRTRSSGALARRVELKSGGYLILEQTEAMTTIDVNTGGYVGTRSFRRYDLQDQSRGRTGDRAPAAPEKPRRHHHHRLHRHGKRGTPRRGARRAEQGARAATGPGSASTASPDWGWSR